MTEKFTIQKSGKTLTLIPVDSGILRNLFAEVATTRGMNKMLATKNGKEVDLDKLNFADLDAVSAIKSSEKIFNYCLGWGIKNKPPKKVPEILELMDVDPTKKRLYRAQWVRYCLKATPEETTQMMSIIIGLSMNGET